MHGICKGEGRAEEHQIAGGIEKAEVKAGLDEVMRKVVRQGKVRRDKRG